MAVIPVSVKTAHVQTVREAYEGVQGMPKDLTPADAMKFIAADLQERVREVVRAHELAKAAEGAETAARDAAAGVEFD